MEQYAGVGALFVNDCVESDKMFKQVLNAPLHGPVVLVHK
jgi:hypothetical protein